MCGADPDRAVQPADSTGSPPRVRSRLVQLGVGDSRDGITSACAEQTILQAYRVGRLRDHLRVCGADFHGRNGRRTRSGSPPRVRSRLMDKFMQAKAQGITSACAEQTLRRQPPTSRSWDHLRVCGADLDPLPQFASQAGSPPRVRSRQRLERCTRPEQGITSACAEQTGPKFPWSGTSRDHLRVCGADELIAQMVADLAGSPPRVRSRP